MLALREAEEGLGVQGQLGLYGKILIRHASPSKSGYQN